MGPWLITELPRLARTSGDPNHDFQAHPSTSSRLKIYFSLNAVIQLLNLVKCWTWLNLFCFNSSDLFLVSLNLLTIPHSYIVVHAFGTNKQKKSVENAHKMAKCRKDLLNVPYTQDLSRIISLGAVRARKKRKPSTDCPFNCARCGGQEVSKLIGRSDDERSYMIWRELEEMNWNHPKHLEQTCSKLASIL